MCAREVIGASSMLRLIRRAVALARMLPILFRFELVQEPFLHFFGVFLHFFFIIFFKIFPLQSLSLGGDVAAPATCKHRYAISPIHMRDP